MRVNQIGVSFEPNACLIPSPFLLGQKSCLHGAAYDCNSQTVMTAREIDVNVYVIPCVSALTIVLA